MSTDQNKSNPVSDPKTVKMEKSTIKFEVLMRFIKTFNGDRDRLSPFIKNCENAMNMANEHQKPILFQYILSQLEGKAEIACSIKIFDVWHDLKTFLRFTFGESKHREHLLLDLQKCKFKPLETITQYSIRIETCLTRLQTDIANSTTDQSELKGRLASTEDLALQTFLLGLPPTISIVVRCRNPRNLNDAIEIATQEEKLQNFMQSSASKTTESRTLKCRICGKIGHVDRNCFSNRRPINSVSQQNPTITFPQTDRTTNTYSKPTNYSNSNICRYCKNIGHDISVCRKRQFNNNLAQQRQQSNSLFGPKRVNNIEEVFENNLTDEDLN